MKILEEKDRQIYKVQEIFGKIQKFRYNGKYKYIKTIIKVFSETQNKKIAKNLQKLNIEK